MKDTQFVMKIVFTLLNHVPRFSAKDFKLVLEVFYDETNTSTIEERVRLFQHMLEDKNSEFDSPTQLLELFFKEAEPATVTS